MIIDKQKNLEKVQKLGAIDKETDVFKFKKVGSKIGQQIINARLAKNMNRVQLANLMCEKESTVAEFENGTAIYDGQKLNKFQRILKIKFDK